MQISKQQYEFMIERMYQSYCQKIRKQKKNLSENIVALAMAKAARDTALNDIAFGTFEEY